MLDLAFQGMIDNIDTKEQVAHISYNADNYTNNADNYTNLNIMHICFPMKIKKETNKDADIDYDLITVSKLFAHFVKEKNITHYGNNE